MRAWTQRGTLHILPARDLAWVLSVTSDRQLRAAAPRYRELGIDLAVLTTAERAVRAALRGGNSLTRNGLFAVLESVGIDSSGQRGIHTIQNLALRGILCQGPVVARPDAIAREQLFVLTEEHIGASVAPSDPVTEMFVRYIDGHGPATAADFAWWSGLTITAARTAATAAGPRIIEVEPGLFLSPTRPRRSANTPAVLALGSFEEYYISYADRALVSDEGMRAAVGPGKNGMVRPILLAEGVVVGTWRHSTALGRLAERPTTDLLVDVSESDAAAALARYAAFVTG